MENTYQEITLPSTVTSSSTTSASRLQETSTPREKQDETATSGIICSRFHKYGSTEKFSTTYVKALLEMTATSQSTEPSSSPKPTVSTDLYPKQSNLCELRHSYKHFHPQLRKRLEKHYLSENSNILAVESETQNMMSDVQQARYGFAFIIQMFTRPEKQYLEWCEIQRGEVLSIRWVFKNHHFVPVKDDHPDPDKARSIADQETIAGGNIKYIGWMFQAQPLDAVCAHAPGSAGTTHKALALVRGGVQAVTCMFEMQPLNSRNKIYHNE